MKIVSTDTQKRMVFIPVINVVPLFITLYNMFVLNEGPRTLFKLYGYIIIYSITPSIIGIIIGQMIPGLLTPFGIFMMYVIPLLTSIGVIKFQEKHLYV